MPARSPLSIHHVHFSGVFRFRVPYVWDDPCSKAFNVLQTALITAPVLAYPDVNRPFILDTDASNIGVGAVLSQQGDSGEQHGNADALSWRLCAAAGCENCPRQEARAQLALMVATLRAVDGEAGWLPLTSTQVQEEQEWDAALAHVRGWLAAGRQPEWADVAALEAEMKAYHSQWHGLEMRDGH
ncbi:hypothetical protein AAFF_G00142920 [Aldrovandia affinis]|uniref:Reverse transcriptase/retrotransposon-derived protein RNase H-like domain-containing protein n=1 Tax=Aldrovandia affinis TaxID=143900 RepID=A0AAD7T094_9TELE|nr:hypothetical protein AAFF_G00142920 [Aldrovandia affinis]